MSPIIMSSFNDMVSFPRVSGDEPVCVALLERDGWFSPRERG